jgi:hypothetical protein
MKASQNYTRALCTTINDSIPVCHIVHQSVFRSLSHYLPHFKYVLLVYDQNENEIGSHKLGHLHLLRPRN